MNGSLFESFVKSISYKTRETFYFMPPSLRALLNQ